MIFEEKIVKSKRIYEGRVVNLRRDEVINVAGKTAQREIVEHSGGAALVVFTNEKKFVLVRQYRNAPARPLTEIPAGKRDGDEDPYETAVRELREETGYTADKIEKLASLYASPGYCEELLHLYLCTELTPGTTDFDESEAIEISEYTASEIMDMIETGEIEDAKTVAAFFLAKHKLEQAGLL